MDAMKVGGEIEAWCTSCKQEKWHVVVAMVGGKPAKVECHGCHKQHAFRLPPGSQPAKKPSSRAKAAAKSEVPPPPSDLDEKLRAGAASARAYHVNERFAVGDFVRHPSFGVGMVTGVPAPQKVEIAFTDGRKLLTHDRGAAAAPTLQKPVRRSDEDQYPTDAPPRK